MNEAVIPKLLDARVEIDAARPFLWCEGQAMTFGEAQDRSDRVAAGLAEAGVERTDRVALLAPNRVEMLELYFACAKLGAIQAPLNAFLKGEFLRYQLDDAQASTIITDEAGYRAVRPLVHQLPELRRVVLLDDHDADLEGPVRVLPYAELAARTAALPRRSRCDHGCVQSPPAARGGSRPPWPCT